MLNTKTISRIAAIQTIYQCGADISLIELEQLIDKMLEFYQQDDLSQDLDTDSKIKINQGYFKYLILSSIEKLEDIDKIIVSSLDEDKKLDTMQPLLLAILRIAVTEIIFPQNITPYKVIINEFTTIASEMLNDTETKFVNFILDKIVKNN